MKVAINGCFGGFGLSEEAFQKLLGRKGIEYERADDSKYSSLGITHYYRKGMLGKDEGYLAHFEFTDNRADPDLIAVIEELGEAANSRFAEIKIVEIPDDVEWVINEYDGVEHVAEVHRTWR
jgi:arginine/lysine/ornithine decarboxylase